ncbi:MAG: transcriptional regulator [Mycobacteriaceae bacterium]|nr:transcriptional regulator [Mycobacterium sp.]NBP84159.1 transcriptional regulator [Mycobacteriaceae bacterium]NBQ41066.1 transcriptional regulator [Mycobacteriaceae bacterium]
MTTSDARDQLVRELRQAYESGASIRSLVAATGRSYGAVHAMLRESGVSMRGRGGPNRRARSA